jgi:hypothetical protein
VLEINLRCRQKKQLMWPLLLGLLGIDTLVGQRRSEELFLIFFHFNVLLHSLNRKKYGLNDYLSLACWIKEYITLRTGIVFLHRFCDYKRKKACPQHQNKNKKACLQYHNYSSKFFIIEQCLRIQKSPHLYECW